jgi:cytochrome c peroxidase
MAVFSLESDMVVGISLACAATSDGEMERASALRGSTPSARRKEETMEKSARPRIVGFARRPLRCVSRECSSLALPRILPSMRPPLGPLLVMASLAATLLGATACDGYAAGAAATTDSRGLDLASAVADPDDALNGASTQDSTGETPRVVETLGGETAGAAYEALPEAPVVPPAPARLVPRLPPELAEGAGIIKSYGYALALGKAFFWDQQVGSDGQACASCHYNAGADIRIQNQLNPGFLDLTRAGGDAAFGSNRSDTGVHAGGTLASGTVAGPNTTLRAADFPLHRLADEADRDSAILTDTNDVVGSMGAFAADFEAIEADGSERCGPVQSEIFHVDTAGRLYTGRTTAAQAPDGAAAEPAALPVASPLRLAARQVEPRNTPSTINAVFNVRQFWDGRANNLFNGVGVFGLRDIEADPSLRLIVAGESGALELGYLSLENASLASQAVGPPLNDIEMSCRGRSFADLGRKLLRSRPLAGQQVAADDSVLGALAHPSGTGLEEQYSYAALIRAAFEPKYWSAAGSFTRTGGVLAPDAAGYTQMETNMPMFWGLSILLYEATLISDESEFDELVASGDITFPGCTTTENVDPLLARGCKIFFRFPFGAPPADGIRGAGCSACHAGAELFSEAAVLDGGVFAPLLQVGDVNNATGTRDLGFANIGTRPAFVDVFLGGTDPYGNPLSFGRQYRQYLDSGDLSVVKDPFLLRAIEAGALVRGPAVNDTAKLESDGATKIPTIRNVALNPPYFSYGGYDSLREVMKFYNRGGNRRQITPENQALEAHGSACTSGDDSGSGPGGNDAYPVPGADCNTNVTGLMQPLGLLDCDANGVVSCDVATDDLSAVARFMQSLSDRRVQCDAGPFDHPSLALTIGHTAALGDISGAAQDQRFELPAVGVSGYEAVSGLCIPNSGNLFAPGMQARAGGDKLILQ